MQIEKRKTARRIGAKRKLWFYIAMMLLPCLQFLIFWVGVNANSILLAFKEFDYDTGKYMWTGFRNFASVFDRFSSIPYFKSALKNSIVIYMLSILIGTPLGICFSFYLYKKKPFGGLFKTILFMPSIISSVVMVIMFKYFVDRAIPGIWESLTGNTMQGLIADSRTTWATIVFYGVWTGFGTSTVIYSSTMGGISDSVVEAAQLDGITPLKELWLITVPMIWPTFVTFIVTGFAAIFTNSAHLYSFFGTEAEYSLYTFGYYIYVETKSATATGYPFLAALGLVLTVVIAPLTVLLRRALNRIGPKTL